MNENKQLLLAAVCTALAAYGRAVIAEHTPEIADVSDVVAIAVGSVISAGHTCDNMEPEALSSLESNYLNPIHFAEFPHQYTGDALGAQDGDDFAALMQALADGSGPGTHIQVIGSDDPDLIQKLRASVAPEALPPQ